MKSKQRAQLIATFKYPIDVKVIRPEFEPFSTFNTVDISRLSKGTHKVEIGFLKGGGCPKLVRAVVSKGMVTAIEVESCEDTKEVPSKEVQGLFAKALKHVKAPAKWKPVPVAEFFNNAEMLRIVIGTGAGCFYICILYWCLFCCWWNWPFFCWIETRTPDVDI
jgi:hypothetical protein